MKTERPSRAMMASFEKIKGTVLVTVVLALIPWGARDWVSSLAATQARTSARVRTIEEPDDARVLRAFDRAQQLCDVEATLAPESDSRQQPRDSRLTVTAKSRRAAVADMKAMTEAMQAAFAKEGPGALYVIDSIAYASAVPNEQTVLVRRVCEGTAMAIALGGLATGLLQWRRTRLPKVALFGLLATAGTLVVFFMGRRAGGAIWGVLLITGLPVLALVLVTRVTLKARQAATWLEGRARITQSEVAVERHRFAGDTTKVTNQASVAYAFNVGTRSIRGDRISIGYAPADQVDETLRRYPVGAIVPVFYDPQNPQDCVLERNPPVSLGRIWAGTVTALLVYAGVVMGFWKGVSISAAFDAAFPQIHHPLVVISCVLMGLFCMASFLHHRRHPFKAYPWLLTPGTIVASAVESYQPTTTDSSRYQTTFYKPVIEFSYRVEGREYHNTIGEPGGMRTKAEAEVARYPVGTAVEVHFDPKNPTRSALEIDTEMMITGRSSLIVALVLFAVAIYAGLQG